MNCHCKDSKQKCGEFKGKESKEDKLAHLKKCKESFQLKIKEIDEAIAKL